MIPKYEINAASALIGVAAFQVWQAWNENAPSLSDMRNAAPGDITARQQLLDAEITVGALVVAVGGIFAMVTRDFTPLFLMGGIFVLLAFFHHWILDADPN